MSLKDPITHTETAEGPGFQTIAPMTIWSSLAGGLMVLLYRRLCSKISGHSIIPCSSFRRRPESSVIYPSTRGRHLGSGFRRSDEYAATGSIDAFDTGS